MRGGADFPLPMVNFRPVVKSCSRLQRPLKRLSTSGRGMGDPPHLNIQLVVIPLVSDHVIFCKFHFTVWCTISWDIQHVAWKLPCLWALDATQWMPSVFDGLPKKVIRHWLDIGQIVVSLVIFTDHYERLANQYYLILECVSMGYIGISFCHPAYKDIEPTRQRVVQTKAVRLPLKSTSSPIPSWYDTQQSKM